MSTYTDIVEPERIVFTYRHVDRRAAHVDLVDHDGADPDGGQTHLTYTEQGVHFDGLDDPAGREEGTKGLLDQLGSYLAPATEARQFRSPAKGRTPNDDRDRSNVGLR